MKTYGTRSSAGASPPPGAGRKVPDADLDLDPDATLRSKRRMACITAFLVVGMVGTIVANGGPTDVTGVDTHSVLSLATSNTCAACAELSDTECLLALGNKWKALPVHEREDLIIIYDFPTSRETFSASSLLDTLTTICYGEVSTTSPPPPHAHRPTAPPPHHPWPTTQRKN